MGKSRRRESSKAEAVHSAAGGQSLKAGKDAPPGSADGHVLLKQGSFGADAVDPPVPPDCSTPRQKERGPWPGGGSLLPQGAGGEKGGGWQPTAQILKLADERSGALTDTSTSASSAGSGAANSKGPEETSGPAKGAPADAEDRFEGTFGSGASNEFSFGTTRPASLPPEAARAVQATNSSSSTARRKSTDTGAAAPHPSSRPSSRPNSRPSSAKGARGAESGDDDCPQEFTFGTSAPLKLPDLSQLNSEAALRKAAASCSSTALVTSAAPPTSARQAAPHREEKLATVQEASGVTPQRPSTPQRPVFPLPPSTPPPAASRYQEEANRQSLVSMPGSAVPFQQNLYMAPPPVQPQVAAWTPHPGLPPGMVQTPEMDLLRNSQQVPQCTMVPILSLNGNPPNSRGAYGPYFTTAGGPSPKSESSGSRSMYSTKLLMAVGCMGVLLVGGAMGVAFLLVT